MSLVSKPLASVGIGAAHVDAVLDSDRIIPGGEVTGTLRVHGGGTSQPIDYVGMALMTQYKRHVDDNTVPVTCVLAEVEVGGAFEIGSREERQWPFTLPVPLQTPLTRSRSQVWVQTTLSVPRALDPQDRDAIRVDPGRDPATVLQALDHLGFTLRLAECRYNQLPEHEATFVQVFEFMPGGAYAGRLVALEVIMAIDGNGMRVWGRVDRGGGGLTDMLFGNSQSGNEGFTSLWLDRVTLDSGNAAVASELEPLIDSVPG